MTTPHATAKPLYTSNIPKLEQNGSNYMTWSMSVRIKLRDTRALSLLTTPSPENDEYQLSLDAQGNAFLLLTIHTALRVSRIELSTIDLWKSLEDIHNRSSISPETLFHSIHVPSLFECKSADEYISQHLQKRAQLVACDPSHSLFQLKTLIASLLFCLPTANDFLTLKQT